MGKLGGMVYSPIINPIASAILIQVCLVPQYSGNFHDLIRRTFAGLVCHVSSVSKSLMSGAMILILTVALFPTRFPLMLIKIGNTCYVANSKMSLFSRGLSVQDVLSSIQSPVPSY